MSEETKSIGQLFFERCLEKRNPIDRGITWDSLPQSAKDCWQSDAEVAQEMFGTAGSRMEIANLTKTHESLRNEVAALRKRLSGTHSEYTVLESSVFPKLRAANMSFETKEQAQEFAVNGIEEFSGSATVWRCTWERAACVQVEKTVKVTEP